MKRPLIVGQGLVFERAMLTAKDAGMDFLHVELVTSDGFNFDLDEIFQNYPCTDFDVFVALDERAVNQTRHKLIADVRLAGYALLNIVSPYAIVASDIKLLGNVHVGAGCNLGLGCRLGTGTWLDPQVLISANTKVGSCATLQAGAQLGVGVEIGRGTTLGPASIIPNHARIGRHCEWLLPGTLPAALPDYSFHDSLMPEGARILN
ncbi:hypothetical protein GCM10007205_24270 [Oxalicibacterium flavum]|uniref:Acetyltransferase n=1 Tax=Oxalicibacterium flavum TaxID=179467 RepID=A0A8J2UM30_9BURK|nr:acetyltransferase [Oxalicibacterium flavum]GGC14562.1 hypothetical protein GCM10007205_24270 [Oxalicibacterium flavum]